MSPRKSIYALAWGGMGLLLGFALTTSYSARLNKVLRREIQTLRESLAEEARSQANVEVQLDRWKTEAERLRKQSEAVFRLRAETSQLRQELSEAKQSLEQSVALTKTKKSIENGSLAEKAANSIALSGGKGEGIIPVEEAPSPVNAAIIREMGDGELRALHVGFEKGKTVYGVKGQLSDGRGFGMRLAEDGTVLTKSTEIPPETLPPEIQTPVGEAFGDINIGVVRQVIDGDNISYELSGKNSEMGVQITVGDDGAILAYSAKLRGPEPKKEKVR